MNDLAICSKISEYWNWRATSFDGTSCSQDEWVEIYAEALALQQGSRVLDLGTGTGFLAIGLADRGYCLTGIDISENMLKIAGKKAKDNRLLINLLRMPADNPDFAPNSFDAIVTRNLIWTLKDPQSAIKNWASMLRKNGRIVISDGIWRPVTFLQKTSNFLLEMLNTIKQNRLEYPEKFKKMYQAVDPDLPFGKGLYSDQARAMLSDCGFMGIASHEHKFSKNPYALNGRCFPGYGEFFILSATRER